jgi:acyl transferase domain-containing protein
MPREPLAIVGIGCRLPGEVSDAASLWSLLIEGKSGIRDVPSDRWNAARYSQAIPGKHVTTKAGYLNRVDQFDAAFFGISPREANQIDPQQRLLLELAWEALEDAGIPPRTLRGTRTGVFVGIASFDYGAIRSRDHHMADLHSATGIAQSIAANRLSYCFDLKGPSLATDTACSSSLVALHLACESIRSGESDAALVGGVNLILSPSGAIVFSMASMLSPDAECYAFDARANGFVRGEGAGVVFVRKLSEAIKNQDRIYATIRATAMNQDGHTVAMMVPGQAAQEDLLREVYEKAGVAPADVAYVEAHGTGTPVGDPIEAKAIGNMLSRGRLPAAPLRIGSVPAEILRRQTRPFRFRT